MHGARGPGQPCPQPRPAPLGVLPAGELTLEAAFAKLQVLPAAAAGGGRVRLGAGMSRIIANRQ